MLAYDTKIFAKKNNRQAYPRSQLLPSDGRMTRKFVHNTGAAFQ